MNLKEIKKEMRRIKIKLLKYRLTSPIWFIIDKLKENEADNNI